MLGNTYHAVVVSQDPDNHGLNVMVLGLPGGQMPTVPVKVLSHGPRDAVRGSFEELPMPGNSGAVAFLRGDLRNGVWIGSFEPALNDASPGEPGQTGVSYSTKYSGHWSWHGPDGTTAVNFADGSTALAGSSMPEPTRHTLTEDQKRERTQFTAAERNPNPPSPFPFRLGHASGAVLSLSAGGSLSASLPAGASATITNGSGTITIDSSGNVEITGASTATVTAATVTVNGDLEVTGEVTGGFGGTYNTLLHHRHPGTGPPTPNT